MSNDAALVSTGKPKIGGAIYRAPLGSTLPTTATEDLDNAFKGVGYISDAGLVNSNSAESSVYNAWGGDEVLTMLQGKSDRMKFTMIECMNPVVLKTVYGSENVTGTLDTGITIRANSKPQEHFAWVADMILNDNVLKRIVVADAGVIEVGDITYVDNQPVGYETTLACKPYSTWEGDTHREYLVKKSTT